MMRMSGGGGAKPKFVSAEMTYVGGVKVEVAHGLGRLPHHWSVGLRCKTASNGYQPGDEIDISGMYDGDAARGRVTCCNETSLSFFGDHATVQNTGADFAWPGAPFYLLFYAW